MSMKTLHRWEATGVTSYPITHPIVGQREVYRTLRSYLELIDEENKFAQVFAVVAPWGVGKSRLGYEVIAQVNNASQGWYVRASDGSLEDVKVFPKDKQRLSTLALYIRYSQVAHESLNLDNWFAPCLLKALEPLSLPEHDSSIQHQVARQSAIRLEPRGFSHEEVAKALELDKHSWETIYEDPRLANRLCQQAYECLKQCGIERVLIVLDELETAAERATSGMDEEEAKLMDGRAIKMLRKAVEEGEQGTLGRREIETLSKAVKEEDARARLPWLRVVALCSPAIGDELKEVQSTDRRFEIVDLDRNAFSDVSTFVQQLESQGRLLRSYPKGLVEAAYMMSGGNFGWFNVIMAVIDQVLGNLGKDASSLSQVFRAAIESSKRVGRYILDHRSIKELNLTGAVEEAVAELLFGQLPRPIEEFDSGLVKSLLQARNAFGEPVSLIYHKAKWRLANCANALIQNRFERIQGTSHWKAPGIPETIDLEQLLRDLSTLALSSDNEDNGDDQTLLLPPTQPEFLQLLDLIHPHPAVEELGRILWTAFVGDLGSPTHLGPSVEMLRRLDIRLRKASSGNVLRNPEENALFSQFLDALDIDDKQRRLFVLTGLLRLLDEHWNYDVEPAGFDLPALKTRAKGHKAEGLLDFKGLWLHRKGLAAFAWANNDKDLEKIQKAAFKEANESSGRFPVIVVTTDYSLPGRFETGKMFEDGREFMLVVHLNSGEESALVSIGAPTKQWKGFRLRREGLTTRFAERLNRIKTPISRKVRDWRHRLNKRGLIAWPWRSNGVLKEEVRKRLTDGWRELLLEQKGKSLAEASESRRMIPTELLKDLQSLGLSPAAAPKGYTNEDQSGLWQGSDEHTQPKVPAFLLISITRDLIRQKERGIDLERARKRWLWGYTWDNNRDRDIFRDWMLFAESLGWAAVDQSNPKKPRYYLVEKSALRGQLEEAENWFRNEYPSIVNGISAVLGAEGVVKQWLDPNHGTKARRAQGDLEDARKALEALEAQESNRPEDHNMNELERWFITCTRLRLRVREQVKNVYLRDEYEKEASDLEIRKLRLDDDISPLWLKIRQARAFTEKVQQLAERIRSRVDSLKDQIRGRATEVQNFPTNLFTRPLEKIHNIVDAGMAGHDPKGSTQRAQKAKSGTLAWYLRELRVVEALKSLEDLAKEVGTGERAGDDLPIDEIDGFIVSTYRNLLKRTKEAGQKIKELGGRVLKLDDALEDAPEEFKLPANLDFQNLRKRPAFLESELEEARDERVEEILESHDERMNQGRFEAVMKDAREQVIDATERGIRALEGRLRTLENAVRSYRDQLLSNEVFHRIRKAVELLAKVESKAVPAALDLNELEKISLAAGKALLHKRTKACKDLGESLLSETGVTFEEWLTVVLALKQKNAPVVEDVKMSALVRKGFLKRVYALTGDM